MTSSPIEKRLHELLAQAPAEYVAVYLFGSQALGRARPDSDVDLGFWRKTPSASTLDEQPYLYAEELGRELGKEVDLVELNKAGPDLVHEVLSHGTIVLDRDPETRVACEVRARQSYLDLRPFLLRYRRLSLAVTNVEVVAKKLAFVEQCIADLRAKARPDLFDADLLQRRFAEHTLQLAIQAALDIASHIVSDQRLGEPKTNAELFAALVRAGVVPAELSTPLAKMAGFRNVLVHSYVEVDIALLAQVVRERLGDLEQFVSAVRAHLGL